MTYQADIDDCADQISEHVLDKLARAGRRRTHLEHERIRRMRIERNRFMRAAKAAATAEESRI